MLSPMGSDIPELNKYNGQTARKVRSPGGFRWKKHRDMLRNGNAEKIEKGIAKKEGI